MIAERIRILREEQGLTQTQLAKQLGITRSSVNAWELGISVPSTQYIVELAGMFRVSTDYLLCVEKTASVDISGLTEADVKLVYELIHLLKEKKRTTQIRPQGVTSLRLFFGKLQAVRAFFLHFGR